MILRAKLYCVNDAARVINFFCSVASLMFVGLGHGTAKKHFAFVLRTQTMGPSASVMQSASP
jgi:hypothetical protein